jgi:hypothetical protein
MTTSFRVGLAVLALLSTLATGPAAAADGSGSSSSEPAPLTGEVLITSDPGLEPGTSEVTGTCNQPFGGSEFSFVVTGPAIGPYPGTFREVGSFTLGPPGFPITSFEAEFWITSPEGTVHGFKTRRDVTSPVMGVGVCGGFVFTGAQAGAVDFQTPVRYIADITTTEGTATDRGESFVTYDDIQLRPPLVEGQGFAFDESFESTSFSGDEDDDGGDDDDDDDDDGGDG